MGIFLELLLTFQSFLTCTLFIKVLGLICLSSFSPGCILFKLDILLLMVLGHQLSKIDLKHLSQKVSIDVLGYSLCLSHIGRTLHTYYNICILYVYNICILYACYNKPLVSLGRFHTLSSLRHVKEIRHK